MTEKIAVTYMSGPWDGKTDMFELERPNAETILTIGRREGCNILLDYDSQVSRIHARLIYETAKSLFFLEDADSRNGTYIGGDKIKGKVRLPQGELFRIGRTWLRAEPKQSDAHKDELEAELDSDLEVDSKDLPF